MKNIKDIIKKLYDYYSVSSIVELAEKMGVKTETFYMWVSRNSINPLKRKIREIDMLIERDMYKEIFGDVVLRDANDLIDRLMEFYGVDTISELAGYIEVSQPTISRWIKNNSIEAIKKKCMELNIYNDIFKHFQENILIFNMFNIQKKLNIIENMIKDNQELENQFNQYLKDFIKGIL